MALEMKKLQDRPVLPRLKLSALWFAATVLAAYAWSPREGSET